MIFYLNLSETTVKDHKRYLFNYFSTRNGNEKIVISVSSDGNSSNKDDELSSIT